MPETEGAPSIPQERKGSIEHDFDGEKVTLNYKEFKPKKVLQEEQGKKTGIFFNPGWAVPIDGIAVEKLCQEYADMSGVSVIATETRGDPKKLKQMQGAATVRKFIEENGYTDVTIIGNSQGGIRAVDEVYLLQQNENIRINGLILLSSMGLSEQTKQDERFASTLSTISKKPHLIDKPLDDPESHFFDRLLERDPGSQILKHPIKNRRIYRHALQMQKELIGDFLTQVKEAGGWIHGVPAGVRNLREEMIHKNPALNEIRVPVVLINGEADAMSNPMFLIEPKMGLEAARTKAHENSGTRNEAVVAREQHLKKLFPLSPEVSMLIAANEENKHGHHALPGFRWRQVAISSLAALERSNRPTYEIPDKAAYFQDRRRFTQPPPAKKAA